MKPLRYLGWGLSISGLLLSCCLAVSAADGAKGSIKGTIAVSGVRSPENVLVYLEKVDGDWPATKEAHVDQVRLVFVPKVLPVVKGAEVEFRNSDPLLHNVMWPAGKGYTARNLGTWGKGSSRKFVFGELGEVVVLCNIHPEMEGHIVVLQNPFFAVAGKDGAYEIKDVPAGTYTVKTWYSQPRKLRSKSVETKVEAGKSTSLDFKLSRR